MNISANAQSGAKNIRTGAEIKPESAQGVLVPCDGSKTPESANLATMPSQSDIILTEIPSTTKLQTSPFFVEDATCSTMDDLKRWPPAGVSNPYYIDESVCIIHGDCREILPSLPKVDLVLTDPPFFMPATHYQSRVGWQRTWGDTSILRIFWSVILDGFVPRLKETGHALIFCNHESFPVFYSEMYSRFDFLKSLVWDKGHVGLGRVWRNQHELIVAARWNSSEFNEDGKLRADVLRYSATQSQNREHPVEKPEELLADLILVTTPAVGIVCDPFMGSGTTLRAAKDLGRRAIGIEIEERYCEIAAKRMAQGVLEFSRAI